jgi:hypothetical protein
MNEQSSRSHFVFTLRISGVNEVYFLIMLYFMFVLKTLSIYCVFLLVDVFFLFC